MSNSDSELDILIKTAADTYGIDATWAAMSKYKNVIGDVNKGSEVSNEHHREMHMLFRQLNRILPESGHLLHGLFGGPEVLLIMATVAAVAKLVEVMKEHNKQAQEALKLQAEMANAVWEKNREETSAARQEVERFNKELATTARAYDIVKQKQDEALAVLQVYNDALVKSAGDDKVRAEALKQEADTRKLLMQEQIVEQDKLELSKAQAGLEEARAARAEGAAGLSGASQSEVKLQADKDRLQKAQEVMTTMLRKAGERVPSDMLTDPITFYKQILSQSRFDENFKKAAADLADAHNSIVADNAAIDAHKRKLDDLTRRETEQEGLVKQRLSQLQSAQAEAHKQRALLGAALETADEAEMTAAGIRPGSVIGRTVLRGVEAGEAATHGAHLTRAQQETVFAIRQALINAGNNQKQINDLLTEMANVNVGHDQKIRDILQAMRMLRSQIQSSVNP